MFRRWKRYFRFGVQYFLYEKPKGLDFTMRDLSFLKSSRGLLQGYRKTEEHHLKEIFGNLSFTGEERLLDIGWGKGVVLLEASSYPFKKMAGIDIDERLITVARKNFQILKMEDQVECIRAKPLNISIRICCLILKKGIWKHCFLSWQSAVKFMMWLILTVYWIW